MAGGGGSRRYSIDITVNAAQAVGAVGQVGAAFQQVNTQANVTVNNIQMGLNKSTDSARGLVGGLAAMSLGMGALRAGVEVIRDVGRGLEDAREMTDAWAKDLIKVRDSLRELATLQGTQATSQFTVDQSKFAQAARMTLPEAKAYRTEFANEAAQFKDKSLKGSEFGEFEARGAALAAAKGLKPDEVARLAGFTLRKDYSKLGDRGAEAATGDLNKAISIAMHGSGSNPVLIGQMGRLMASTFNEDDMKGSFHRLEDVATAVSVAAEKSAPGAENLVRAGIRATGRLDDKHAGGLLKKAGIDATTPFLERFDKLQPLLAAEAKQRGTTVDAVIGQHFHSIREAEAVRTFVNRGAGPGGAIAERRQFARGIDGFADAEAAVAKFRRDAEGPGPNRDADAELERAKLEKGAEKSRFLALHKQAEAAMIREGRLGTADAEGEYRRQDRFNPLHWVGISQDAREQAIGGRMASMIAGQARAAGMKLPAEAEGVYARQLGGGNPEVQSALVNGIQKQIELLEKQNELLRQAVGAKGKLPIPQAQPKAGAAHP